MLKMLKEGMTLVILLFIFNGLSFAIFEEPVCSKFHFEEKVLEKLINLEVRVNSELKILEEKNKKLTVSMATVSEAVNAIQQKTDEDSNMEEALKKQILFVTNEIKDLKANISWGNPRFEASNAVFFVAHTTSNSLAQDKPVIYQQTVANPNNHYDITTGKFIAPVRGVYIFSAQICSENHVDYQIKVSNVPYSSSFRYSGKPGVCGSVTTTALLAREEQVWVEIINSGVKVHQKSADSNPAWNMFTGTLVMKVG